MCISCPLLTNFLSSIDFKTLATGPCDGFAIFVLKTTHSLKHFTVVPPKYTAEWLELAGSVVVASVVKDEIS